MRWGRGTDERWRRARAGGPRWLGMLLLAWACGGDGATGPGPLARIELTWGTAAALVGDTARLSPRLLDAQGRPTTAAGAIGWTSSAPAVAAVDASGFVRALSPGSAVIRAAVGAVSGEVRLTVEPAVPASITFSPDTASVSIPGGTLTLRAEVRDASGRRLTDPVLFWRSLDPRLATVDLSGRVTGVAAGVASIEASAQGAVGTVRVRVRPRESASAPRITAVAPLPLLPGASVTLTGSNFGATAAANQVVVDGVAATVTAATATSLTVRLPVAGFPCAAERTVAVQVTVGTEVGAADAPLRGVVPRALAVGEAAVLHGEGEGACTAWTGGRRYLVSAYHAGTGQTAVAAGFTLRGSALTAAGQLLAAPPAEAAVARDARARADAGANARAARGPGDDAHGAWMRQQIEFLRRTGAPRSLRRTTAEARLQAIEETLTTVGAITPLRIPDADAFNACTQFIAIGARTVWVGAHSVIVEDTASAAGGRVAFPGTADSLYRRMGEEFEAVSWPILTSAFGDPLAMDRRLRDRGKVVIIFSPRVNGFRGGGIEAFVAACDGFPRAEQPSSNEGAVFYGRVPMGAGGGIPALPADAWMRTMRATMAHELKHVVSFAERLADGRGFEDAFLEEGTARHAEELFGRALYGNVWRGNAGYRQTVFCEVNWTNTAQPACLGRPYVMARHFVQLNRAWLLNEAYSPLVPLGFGDGTWYSTTWALTRWLADQAPDERAFLRGLTTAGEIGTANIAARAGRSWGELLGEFTLAVGVAGRTPPPGLPARLRFPSWDLRDVFRGLCEDFGPCTDPGRQGEFVRPYPLQPRAATLGSFAIEVPSVSVGAFALFELSVPAGTTPPAAQLLELRGAVAGSPPPGVRIAVLRLE